VVVNSGSSATPSGLTCPNGGVPAGTIGLDKFFNFALSKEEAKSICSIQPVGNCPVQEGDFALLVAMHVSTKEDDNWTWQTFWWNYNQPFPYGAPPADVPAPFNNYAMCTAYSMTAACLVLDDTAVPSRLSPPTLRPTCGRAGRHAEAALTRRPRDRRGILKGFGPVGHWVSTDPRRAVKRLTSRPYDRSPEDLAIASLNPRRGESHDETVLTCCCCRSAGVWDHSLLEQLNG